MSSPGYADPATPFDQPAATRDADGPARSFGNARLHRLFATSRVARALSMGLMARLELAILSGHKKPATMSGIRGARRGRESLLSGNEAFTLYSFAEAQSALDGDMAELGVYQGCSAKIIGTASRGRPLHLFDTFAGLPTPDDGAEAVRYQKGNYCATLPYVRQFLSETPNVSFHQGYFPETAGPVADRRFSFVHLDVDLRSSTLAGLEFFYPRMVQGGIILTHDYSYLDGVRSAFADFFRDKPEFPLELPTSQAMIVKR